LVDGWSKAAHALSERVHRLVAEFSLLGDIEQGRFELGRRFDGRLERHLQRVAHRQALGHPSAHGIEGCGWSGRGRCAGAPLRWCC